MAKRKLTWDIEVNEKEVSIGNIVKNKGKGKTQDVIAAIVLIDEQIAQLKSVNDMLKEKLKNEDFDTIMDEFVMDDDLPCKDYTPVIKVKSKYGTEIKVVLSADTENNFEVSKDLSDKSLLDSIVPDKYKKYSVTLDKKVMESDYLSGDMPEILKRYCKTSPETVTKMKKTSTKEA